MESNSVCNHTSDNKIGTTAKQESDLLITSMIADSTGRQLPINHNSYNFSFKEELVIVIYKYHN